MVWKNKFLNRFLKFYYFNPIFGSVHEIQVSFMFEDGLGPIGYLYSEYRFG